jgi:hypothetical protein
VTQKTFAYAREPINARREKTRASVAGAKGGGARGVGLCVWDREKTPCVWQKAKKEEAPQGITHGLLCARAKRALKETAGARVAASGAAGLCAGESAGKASHFFFLPCGADRTCEKEGFGFGGAAHGRREKIKAPVFCWTHEKRRGGGVKGGDVLPRALRLRSGRKKRRAFGRKRKKEEAPQGIMHVFFVRAGKNVR